MENNMYNLVFFSSAFGYNVFKWGEFKWMYRLIHTDNIHK